MGCFRVRGCDDVIVSFDGGVEQREATPPLPSAIWVVAWASLAGQALLLVWQGGRLDDAVSLVLSVVLGALVVGYVSAGVVRARTVRLVLAWVVLVLSGLFELVGLVAVNDVGQAFLAVLSLATTALALAGLASFVRTDWYVWQRTRPSAREGVPIGQLISIGVLVGVLGGLTGPVDDGVDVRISVADR
jgi:peptidoglycan/LPS O-acetylase OafA/YrhL